MRSILFAVVALTVFASQAAAFNWVSGGGARDTKAARVLAQSYVAASVTGTAAETTLATYVVPGGTMGPNCSLRITHLGRHTNSGNNKIIRVRIGGVQYQSFTDTATDNYSAQTYFRNRNSLTSQIGGLNFAAALVFSAVVSANAPVTSSINTAADVTITITGQLANTGETITLDGYTIELLPGS